MSAEKKRMKKKKNSRSYLKMKEKRKTLIERQMMNY